MEIMQELKEKLVTILQEMGVSEEIDVDFSVPTDPSHGDYTTNVAFAAAKILKKSPMEVAKIIVEKLGKEYSSSERSESRSSRLVSLARTIDKIEVANPGFVNFFFSKEYFINRLNRVIASGEKVDAIKNSSISDKKIMVEYAHPNTHKELHIGHMRTLITGEALARIFEANGARVFRANYQGDIGPHVAKALYGIQKIMHEKGLTIDQAEKWSDADKAHFLGEGYIRGNVDYTEHKSEIDSLNSVLYTQKSGPEIDLYKRTRQWSLDYYDKFYTRFYTKFDQLFFESNMIEGSKAIIMDNLGTVFVQDDDTSIFFPGEKYGLHRRVFITQAGNPTYEGKEICLGFAEYEAFHFDKKIHVVGSEQAGYFQVVFKALEQLDPGIFKDKQYHLPMGMVQLKSGKMSSRTGEILRVDMLIDDVKNAVRKVFKDDKIPDDEKEKVLEQVTIGAIKYSVLKVGAKQDVAFDIEKSVSLDGDSGPYIQYTYARTQSILEKAKEKGVIANEVKQSQSKGIAADSSNPRNDNRRLSPEELLLLRTLSQFPEIVKEAGETIAPNVLCTYLYELAKAFNLFYQKHRILDVKTNVIPTELEKRVEGSMQQSSGEKDSLTQQSFARNDKREAQAENIRKFRLQLTKGVGNILYQGLHLLGIEAPKRM